MEKALPIVTMYEVDLVMFNDDENEHSASYYTRIDDAKRIALTLCKLWLENPWRYLVTTNNDDIRIYEKVMDERLAAIFIREHHYAEVG